MLVTDTKLSSIAADADTHTCSDGSDDARLNFKYVSVLEVKLR